MMQSASPRARLIIIIAVFIVVIIGVSLLFILFSSGAKNSYGDYTPISGLSSKTKNVSDDRKDSITAYLYKMLKLNNPTSDISKINDVVIRKDSNSEKYSDNSDTYTGEFIVDIQSVKQSYKIWYIDSDHPEDTGLGGYLVIISCLPKDKLIYGEFNCKELNESESKPIKLDPIVDSLPYYGLSYEISYVTLGDGKVSLRISLLLSDADRENEASAVAKYKSQALNWLLSEGFNPKDYKIAYSY